MKSKYPDSYLEGVELPPARDIQARLIQLRDEERALKKLLKLANEIESAREWASKNKPEGQGK